MSSPPYLSLSPYTSSPSLLSPPMTSITNDAREDEMDENLAHVDNMMTELHGLATDMNSEIRQHNQILNRIDDKTQLASKRVGDADDRAHAYLGKSSKPKEKILPSKGDIAGKMMMN